MPGYDYTREDDAVYDSIAPGSSAPSESPDDFVIAAPAESYKTAEEIEAESVFRDIPPGEHELVVCGFSKPKLERKDVYVNGKRASYSAYSVLVKLCLADDPRAQISDYFILPPATASELPAYLHGSKGPEGKGAGFMASKFYYFIQRIGFVYPKGGLLPAEALRLGNWKGRRIIATVEAGKPYFDAVTGENKPGKPSVKLMSYRPASGSNQPPAGAAQASPARRPNRPATAPMGLGNGLENI